VTVVVTGMGFLGSRRSWVQSRGACGGMPRGWVDRILLARS
jgi:hypothetical protein